MKPITLYSDAHQVLAIKGKSFYWASHFLGKKYRHRATRLYSFCRYLDDMVDEEVQVVRAKQNIAQAQQAILLGFSNHPTLTNGIELIRQCHIPPNIILELIAGIESDAGLVRIANELELLSYCYQVAGTVGLMMCHALDIQEPEAVPYAINLGIAMQLTNICRDIKTDALANRRYIPINLLGNIEIDGLIAPNEEQARILRLAVSALLKLADVYYQSGEKGLVYLPLRARISILIAVRIYHDIGNRLRSENYEYWHQRIFVSTLRKIVITLSTIVAVCSKSHFWFRPKHHEEGLHESLHASSQFRIS